MGDPRRQSVFVSTIFMLGVRVLNFCWISNILKLGFWTYSSHFVKFNSKPIFLNSDLIVARSEATSISTYLVNDQYGCRLENYYYSKRKKAKNMPSDEHPIQISERITKLQPF
jgi:hypothetical protein